MKLTFVKRLVAGLLSSMILCGPLVGSVMGQEDGYHTVSHGEYLKLIADHYGVTVDQLIEWNGLTSNMLYTGDQLLVNPEQAQDWADTMHYIHPGETLYSIAKYYGVTVEDLMAWNQLQGNRIVAGSLLKVRGPITGNQPVEEATGHVVQAGDTLWSIANRYGISVMNLTAWNFIDESTPIYPGLYLTLIDEQRFPTEHVVVAGETLRSIAELHGIFASDLMKWNNLTSSHIYPGQKLSLVPKGDFGYDYQVYTVAPGDNLWKIAYQYQVTVAQLMAWNNLGTSLIYPGTQLIVSQP